MDFEGWSVATVHLESMRHKSAHRLTQLEQIQDQLEDAAELVLLGDFNVGMRSREQAFLETLEFVDVWPALRPNEPGYTEDTQANTMRLSVRGAHEQA